MFKVIVISIYTPCAVFTECVGFLIYFVFNHILISYVKILLAFILLQEYPIAKSHSIVSYVRLNKFINMAKYLADANVDLVTQHFKTCCPMTCYNIYPAKKKNK